MPLVCLQCQEKLCPPCFKSYHGPTNPNKFRLKYLNALFTQINLPKTMLKIKQKFTRLIEVWIKSSRGQSLNTRRSSKTFPKWDLRSAMKRPKIDRSQELSTMNYITIKIRIKRDPRLRSKLRLSHPSKHLPTKKLFRKR